MFKNHFIITLFISSLCFVANAQNVVFADTIFEKLLVNTICADLNGGFKPDADADANNDGEIQVSEASGVKGQQAHTTGHF